MRYKELSGRRKRLPHQIYKCMVGSRAKVGPAFSPARVFLAVIALTVLPLAAEKRGVTPEDYFAFKNVTDARLSPDGKQVAYVVTSADAKKNRRESQIWVVPRDGSRPAQPLTTGTSAR